MGTARRRRADKNVRMLAMASARTQASSGRTVYMHTHKRTGASRLLAGEAEERYITRPDKPVQRNILEIRSAIIHYRLATLFFSLRARARRSISARSLDAEGKKLN